MTWDEAYEKYDDYLNTSPMVTIGELSYEPARVLREVDPIAYRTGFNDFADAYDINTDELIGIDRQ